jgi:hypothetical protein
MKLLAVQLFPSLYLAFKALLSHVAVAKLFSNKAGGLWQRQCSTAAFERGHRTPDILRRSVPSPVPPGKCRYSPSTSVPSKPSAIHFSAQYSKATEINGRTEEWTKGKVVLAPGRP